MQVYSRDQGVCAVCKTDCHKLEQTRTRYRKAGYLAWQQYCQELNQQGFSGADHASLWQADHIVAVKDGGGECGLDNLQTLCTSCHQRKTTEMRKRHAKTKAVDL